jgi:hypothetical protein
MGRIGTFKALVIRVHCNIARVLENIATRQSADQGDDWVQIITSDEKVPIRTRVTSRRKSQS